MARRAGPSELRGRVVDLAEGGRKVAEVAVELEVGKQTIYTWSRMQVELLNRKRWKNMCGTIECDL